MLRRLARTSVGITGIHTLDGLRTGARYGLFGGQRRISIALYEQAVNEDNADELTAEILERFGATRGIYKRTYSDRFREFDRRSLGILREKFSRDRSLKVHDMAVSDGRTAVDFFELLSPVFPSLEFTASDYSNSIRIAEALGGSVAFSESGEPLEVTWPPFVHNLSKREIWKAYPINFVHEQLALKTLLPLARSRLKRGMARTVSLYCRRALDLQRRDVRFTMAGHDLLVPFKETDIDVVRAMNILHDGYFTPGQVTAIASNVLRGLKDGGVFIIGRNEGPDSPVSGSIYQRAGDIFSLLWHSGDCEAKAMVLKAAV
jgi:hypothetical protein